MNWLTNRLAGWFPFGLQTPWRVCIPNDSEHRLKRTTPFFTHYTRTPEAVANILTNGFAFVPNGRRLIHKLVPDQDFGAKEPQQFGMISFTERNPLTAGPIRRAFGGFGITVSTAWAAKHHIGRVVYIDDSGPAFGALSALFQRAYRATKAAIPFPEDTFWQLAYTNRFAGLSTPDYAALLALYEFMEPAENAFQYEWRIVKDSPLSGYPASIPEIIANVSPPRGWAQLLNVVTITPTDVVGLVCPSTAVIPLRRMLPSDYKSHPIYGFAD